MVDYGRLIDEEESRQDSALANLEAQNKREIELVAFFRNVEIALGKEMAKANQELKRRGVPTIGGPFRPDKGEELIELTFGNRRPCCRLKLESIAKEVGLSRISVELLNDANALTHRVHYLLEGADVNVKAYRPLVEDFPDKGAECTDAEIAQEIVPGILRGRFA